MFIFFFFFSSRRRHTRLVSDWSSDVCSSDLRDAERGAASCKGHERCGACRHELQRLRRVWHRAYGRAAVHGTGRCGGAAEPATGAAQAGGGAERMILTDRVFQLIDTTLHGDATQMTRLPGGLYQTMLPAIADASQVYGIYAQQAGLQDIQGRG